MSEPHETSDVPDELFARVAVSRRFAGLRALGECLTSLREAARRSPGTGRQTLSTTMLRQGVLTREEVETVLAIARAGELSVRRIEDLAIITKIGEGGMGAVYAAMDVKPRELCAVKVLPRNLAGDKDLVRRFKREAEVAVGLEHENLVCGIRTGEIGGVHYFAMEFVDGETVYDRLEREGTIPEGDALRVVRGACLGLQYAADRGLVHRDIKPENIMVTHDGTAKLLDLGLVKKAEAGRVSRLTQDGMAIGTPHYISPEQARGEHDVDARSDIYALGATAYHMLTGNVPFEGSTAAVIMTKHLTEELDWPSDVNPEITEHASRLVSRMMAKEPHNRYQRPKGVVADIDLILSGRAPSGDLLPPGASSIRGAVKMRRAIERTERKKRELSKSGTTAVHERIRKRAGIQILKILKRHKRISLPVAGALSVLAVVALAIALAGGDGPARKLPDLPAAPAQMLPTRPAEERPPRTTTAVLAERLEELMEARVERLPDLMDALSDLKGLTPEQARLVFAAKRAARERFDAEAERRLKDVLSREERGLLGRAGALAELEALREAFGRSAVVARIMAAIADHTGPARPRAPEIRGVPLVDAEGFEGWKAYGDWRLERGRESGESEIVFRFDPEKRYSHALQSSFGFGEGKLTAEIYTDGGERGEISIWDQATQDTEGKPEADKGSAVRLLLGEAEVAPARGTWVRLEVSAGRGGVSASFGGTPLTTERAGGLMHGRLTFSFVGGLWRVRRLQLVPELADGDVAYEVGFAGEDSHGWKGRKGPASLAAERVRGEWGVWAFVGARGERGEVGDSETLFELAGAGGRVTTRPGRDNVVDRTTRPGRDNVVDRTTRPGRDNVVDRTTRLAVAFRAEGVPVLKVRIVAKREVYELRLSGSPPQGRWTALTVPFADFRSKEGEAPPKGADVTGLWIGAPAAQPELEISLVRVVR